MKQFLLSIIITIVTLQSSILLADKLTYEEKQQLEFEKEIARQKAMHTRPTLPSAIDYSSLNTLKQEKKITVKVYTEDDCDD